MLPERRQRRRQQIAKSGRIYGNGSAMTSPFPYSTYYDRHPPSPSALPHIHIPEVEQVAVSQDVYINDYARK